MFTFIRPLLAAVPLLLAQAVAAAPVTYDEAVSGDLNDQGFAFDYGTNTITGTLRLMSVYVDGRFDHYDSDMDAFYFTLPAGAAMGSATLQATFFDTTSNTKDAQLIPYLWSFDSFLSECYVLHGPGGSPFCPSVPADGVEMFDPWPTSVDPWPAPDLYRLSTGASVGNITPGLSYGGLVTYTMTFRVQAVPEPATVGLAGLALGLMGAVTRRRRRLNG